MARQIFISQDVGCDKDQGIFLPVKNAQVQQEKQNFCVCVKPLDFPNEPRLAERLTEWIESNLQLGAQKIVIYVYSSKCIIYLLRSWYVEVNGCKISIVQLCSPFDSLPT